MRRLLRIFSSRHALVLIVLLVLALTSCVASGILAARNGGVDESWWEGLLLNFGTEMGGAVVTFILLERIIGSHEQKERLIRQLGSRVPGEALRAAEELHALGMTRDGSLRGVVMTETVLTGASLPGAVLTRARINWADLREIDLSGADLTGADLGGSKFEKVSGSSPRAAVLRYARLNGAILGSANLTEVDLEGADLRGADLREATLDHANIDNARFDQTTILPNGSYWSKPEDIEPWVHPPLVWGEW